jgi:hypothetical protein
MKSEKGARESLDAAHSTWANAWSVGDGAHEVRTILPLRTARSVLAMVGSYRCFVLEYFAGEWDLRPPAAQLPVIITTSQAELEQRIEEVTHSHRAMAGVASIYLDRKGVGNPCFVKVENERDANGTAKVDLAQRRSALLHEITHQILYECSKFACDPGHEGRFDPWLTEGIAAFLPCHVLVDGAWVLKHSRGFTARDGVFVDRPFAWCQAHADQLPAIKDLAALTMPRWATQENAHASSMLTAFLLEGRDREYRADFCALASIVHQTRATADSFAACFKGVDLAALDKQFKAFCREIKLDEK